MERLQVTGLYGKWVALDGEYIELYTSGRRATHQRSVLRFHISEARSIDARVPTLWRATGWLKFQLEGTKFYRLNRAPKTKDQNAIMFSFWQRKGCQKIVDAINAAYEEWMTSQRPAPAAGPA